jgi:hypothetical protein
MRPVLIVINPPRFNLLSRIMQRDEDLRVQTLSSSCRSRLISSAAICPYFFRQ